MKAKNKTLRAAVLLCVCLIGIVALILISMQKPGRPRNGLGKSFEYDLSEFTRTDPHLLKWAETARIGLTLAEPRALAIGSDAALYVAGDNAVVVYDTDGRQRGSIDVQAAAACLAVDPEGTLYLGIRDHVEVYDSGGKWMAAWRSLGAKAELTSIAADTGFVYAADAGNGVVVCYDKRGRETNRIGGPDPTDKAGRFVIPSPYFDVAAVGNDTVWVVNPGRRELILFSALGRRLVHWGKTAMSIDGFSGCCNPTHIAYRANGSLVTSEKGLARVKVLGAAGELRAVVAGPESFGTETVVMDLAVDSRDRIFVLDPDEKAVRIFSAKSEPKEKRERAEGAAPKGRR